MRTYDVDNYWILGKSVEIKVSSKMAGYKMNLPFNADYLVKVVDNKELYSSYDANEKIGKNIYLNNNRSGVAWFVQSYLTYNDDMSKEEVAMLINSEDFTPLTVAAVNIDTCNKDELSEVTNGTDFSKIELKEYKNNSFTLQTESDCTRLMATSEVYANGWKCYIDGEKTNIIEVNYGFKGVVVPEGVHNILFVYTPPYLTIEIVLTIFGVLIIIIGIILEKKRFLN